MAIAAFQSSGLLSGSAFDISSPEETQAESSTLFKSSGLLSTRSHAESPLLDESNGTSLFQLGGLLGQKQESSTVTNPTSSSQSSFPLSPKQSLFTLNGLLDDDAPQDPVPSTSGTNVIRATTFSGRPVTIKRKARTVIQSTPVSSTTLRVGNLLDVPMHRMMEQLSVNTAKRLSKEADQPVNATPSDDTALWVDRYRPQRFVDLMGNERVARETMTWVKQWDWCVFGKRKEKHRAKEDVDNEDEYRRPKEKILLISGPPGLGKTTLAHVVAKQAGYQVMEINASDARSGNVVDDRIRPALESGSAVGSSKPVLLVIDEIDGATAGSENAGGFIHKLIQLTYDKPRKKARPGQKRDPHVKRPLLRPIICICNDINAASLAKLRPIACQVRFQRPADVLTVRRLREVCALEGLKADTRAISTLVGVAKGDLRGCLNMLQFIKARDGEVTEPVVRKATIGMKENETSISVVLDSIFLPLPKRRVKELGLTEEEEGRYVGRISREIDACDKDSSLAVACFAHYATLRQHDSNFDRYLQANEWLLTFDRFNAAMYNDGDFALVQYLPYCLVPFYPLFSERGGAKVSRSQDDWESIKTARSNEEIYKSLARGLHSASTRQGGDYRHLVSSPIMELEFAPFLNRILSPPLRPVNSQIIKPGEKVVLDRLVRIMATLQVQFFPERAEDNQLTYRMDPPIDVFVTYDGKRASDIAVSRYAVRHIVALAVEAELTARKTDFVEKGKRGKHDFFGKSSPTKRSAPGEEDTSNKRARTQELDIADRPPTDFFGRPLKLTVKKTVGKLSTPIQREFRVAYKFAEGNSAAVRKPVKMNSFW